MELMTIELRNEKAAGLLHELEELDIIRILPDELTNDSKQKLSEKYWGIIPSEARAGLTKHVDEIRNEWEQNT